jgi:Periplasmic copper-binding protein (NosD)
LKVLASVLIAVGCLLAVPVAAGAATFTVDSVNDEADAGGLNGVCLSTGLKCTLRAAVEESNASTSVKDTIKFAAAFNGQLADTIAITLGELQITDEVTIDGDNGAQCVTEATVSGPCVGVSGSVGLDVLSEDVEIKGLAITGAGIGIAVLNESTGFTATNNWLGVKLDGSAGANTTGIFIDPGSDFASIGGTNAAERNVFANNSNEGLDVEGASEAVIRGNYFGVAPNGATAAPNSKNIEVTDSTAGGGFAAEGNQIGRTIEGAELASAACDGGCNVIAGATSTGIDLHGNVTELNEAPASGPTTVHGNYVGLTAAGTAVVANATYGILSGGSDGTTIGGPENGDANFIVGGGTGIYHENGEGFEAAGNVIGAGPTGADLASPGLGMFVFCLNNANPVVVDGNVIEMDGGTAIEQRFGGAEITDNFIEGGQYGILTFADPGAVGGNLIEDNVIGESTLSGIQIENDLNEVLGNSIYESGGAGILVKNQVALVITTENVIGGDTASDENNIRESGGDAIEIVDTSGAPEDSENEVARNRGEENKGLFIDLVGAANGGILPPGFGTATVSGANGTAEPGATVRVFRKASTEAGELQSFLAAAVAGGSGKWKVTYPASIPGGTRVAATQTSAAGATSELAVATTAPAPVTPPPLCPAAGCGPAERGDPPPETSILKGPKGKVAARRAKFRFASSDPGSRFECKLDRKPFRKCKSPRKYKNLKPGRHVFRVRAIDAADSVDPTPAKRRWRVVAP